MPRKKRASSPLELYNDDDFDEDASSHSSQPPVQRNAANARERMRMRVLSSAYGRLKTKLPNIPPDTKLSKLDTLRLATLYIKQLINAVETGSGSPQSHSSAASLADMLDTRHHATDCGSSASSGGGGVGGAAAGTSFNFHNPGHLSMSWPFEFHQHLQQTNQNRNSNNLSFSSSRMDWQSGHRTQSYPKTPQVHETHNNHPSSEMSYTQLQDTHWYPAEMGSMNGNHCCAYESSSGLGQHQRGITISSSQAHTL